MLRYEKYLKKIAESPFHWCEFVRDNILPSFEGMEEKCSRISCSSCAVLQALWLMQEYEEPEADRNEKSVHHFVWTQEMKE